MGHSPTLKESSVPGQMKVQTAIQTCPISAAPPDDTDLGAP